MFSSRLDEDCGTEVCSHPVSPREGTRSEQSEIKPGSFGDVTVRGALERKEPLNGTEGARTGSRVDAERMERPVMLAQRTGEVRTEKSSWSASWRLSVTSAAISVGDLGRSWIWPFEGSGR